MCDRLSDEVEKLAAENAELRVKVAELQEYLSAIKTLTEFVRYELTEAVRENSELRAVVERLQLATCTHDPTEAVAAVLQWRDEDGKQIQELQDGMLRLRKIAAHVPSRVYMKAREDAGYPVIIKPV